MCAYLRIPDPSGMNQSSKDGLLIHPPHITRHAGPHHAVHEQGAHDFLMRTREPLSIGHGYSPAPVPSTNHSSSYLRRLPPRQVPVALAADPGQDPCTLPKPTRQKMAHLGATLAPLFPIAYAHPPAQPIVQFGDRSAIIRDAKVGQPHAQVLCELGEPVLHRDSPFVPSVLGCET